MLALFISSKWEKTVDHKCSAHRNNIFSIEMAKKNWWVYLYVIKIVASATEFCDKLLWSGYQTLSVCLESWSSECLWWWCHCCLFVSWQVIFFSTVCMCWIGWTNKQVKLEECLVKSVKVHDVSTLIWDLALSVSFSAPPPWPQGLTDKNHLSWMLWSEHQLLCWPFPAAAFTHRPSHMRPAAACMLRFYAMIQDGQREMRM